MTLRRCAFTGCGVSLAGPPLSESSRGKPALTGLFEVGEETAYFTSHTIEDCTVNGKTLFYAASQDSVTVPEDAGIVEEASNDSGLSIIKETELETVGSADELLTEEAENSDLPDTQNNADEGKGNEASIADLNLPDEGLQITYIEEVEEATGMQ